MTKWKDGPLAPEAPIRKTVKKQNKNKKKHIHSLLVGAIVFFCFTFLWKARKLFSFVFFGFPHVFLTGRLAAKDHYEIKKMLKNVWKCRADGKKNCKNETRFVCLISCCDVSKISRKSSVKRKPLSDKIEIARKMRFSWKKTWWTLVSFIKVRTFALAFGKQRYWVPHKRRG